MKQVQDDEERKQRRLYIALVVVPMAFAAMVTLPLSASNWMKVRCLNSVRPFHLFVPRGTGGEVKPGVKAGLNHGWREAKRAPLDRGMVCKRKKRCDGGSGGRK